MSVVEAADLITELTRRLIRAEEEAKRLTDERWTSDSRANRAEEQARALRAELYEIAPEKCPPCPRLSRQLITRECTLKEGHRGNCELAPE